MAEYRTKAEVKAALKSARALLRQANRQGDRMLIQRRLQTCEELSDLLESWKGK